MPDPLKTLAELFNLCVYKIELVHNRFDSSLFFSRRTNVKLTHKGKMILPSDIKPGTTVMLFGTRRAVPAVASLASNESGGGGGGSESGSLAAKVSGLAGVVYRRVYAILMLVLNVAWLFLASLFCGRKSRSEETARGRREDSYNVRG